MNNRLDIIRQQAAPIGSSMYVYYHGTTNIIPVFNDRACTELIEQPFILMYEDVHFYCENTVRVDIKIENNVYPGGYLLIEDQLMINQDTYFDRLMTLNDTSLVVDNNGNIMTSEL